MCNVIFMRMMSLFVKNLWGFERFHVPFSFCQRESPFAQRYALTATFCVGALAVRMRSCVTHGVAGATDLQLLSGVLNKGVKLFNFVGKSIVNFLIWRGACFWGFYNIPLLLCFLLSTFGHRLAKSFPSVLVNLLSTHE